MSYRYFILILADRAKVTLPFLNLSNDDKTFPKNRLDNFISVENIYLEDFKNGSNDFEVFFLFKIGCIFVTLQYIVFLWYLLFC